MPSTKKTAPKKAPAKRKAAPRQPSLRARDSRLPSNAVLVLAGKGFPAGPVDILCGGRTISVIADSKGNFEWQGVSGVPGVCTAKAYVSVKGELVQVAETAWRVG